MSDYDYEPCCEACGLPWEGVGSLCAECQSPTQAERIQDGELLPEDAEKLVTDAEERMEGDR